MDGSNTISSQQIVSFDDAFDQLQRRDQGGCKIYPFEKCFVEQMALICIESRQLLHGIWKLIQHGAVEYRRVPIITDQDQRIVWTDLIQFFLVDQSPFADAVFGDAKSDDNSLAAFSFEIFLDLFLDLRDISGLAHIKKRSGEQSPI